MGGAAAGLGLWPSSTWAQTDPGYQRASLLGTDFDLSISETMMDFTGSPRRALTVNGGVPSPTLRWREGDTVTLRVANRFHEDTSIHWHGILLPANMDGVPGLSFDGIRPGETYVYRFTVRQGGTYWYHPGFPIWSWYPPPENRRRALIFLGSDARNPAAEGDTQWVNYKPSHFSSRSMGI